MRFAFLLVFAFYCVKLTASPTVTCDGNFKNERSEIARAFATRWDMARVRQDIEALTGEIPLIAQSTFRLTDRKSAEHRSMARHYLLNALEDLPVEIRLERFGRGMNIVAEIKGTVAPNEIFEVTAHYDSETTGADDNGGGIGLMLEMARLYSANPGKRTLRIVFMDLEEAGGIGSEHHADLLHEELSEAKGKKTFLGALVVDTIAWNPAVDKVPHQLVVLEIGEEFDFREKDSARCYLPSGNSFGATRACSVAMTYQYLRYAGENDQRGALRMRVDTHNAKPNTGDHGSYWTAGLPAVFLSAPIGNPNTPDGKYTNPNYEKVGDTVHTMNWAYYENVSRMAIEFTSYAIETPRTSVATLPALKLAQSQGRNQLDPSSSYIPRLEAPRPPPPPPPTPQSGSHSEGQSKAWAIAHYPENRDRVMVVEGNDSKIADLLIIDPNNNNHRWTFAAINDNASVYQARRAKALANRVLILRKQTGNFISHQDNETVSNWFVANRSQIAAGQFTVPPGFEVVPLPAARPISSPNAPAAAWSEINNPERVDDILIVVGLDRSWAEVLVKNETATWEIMSRVEVGSELFDKILKDATQAKVLTISKVSAGPLSATDNDQLKLWFTLGPDRTTSGRVRMPNGYQRYKK